MFTVSINDKPESNWTKLDFSRSIDENVGTFSISGTLAAKDSKIQANDFVNIYFKNQVVMTGVIDRISIRGGRDGTEITYSGRDVVCDAVDSCVPDKLKNIKGEITLKNYAEKLISGLGLTNKVIDTTKDGAGSKPVKQQKTIESGEKALEAITKMAAKLQLWIVADEKSDLLIMRAGELDLGTKYCYLKNGAGLNNILDAELEIDTAEIFNKVKVRGKGSVAFDINASNDNVTDLSGYNYDEMARPTRYLEIKTNDTMTLEQIKQRAQDEINYRKAKSVQYRISTNFFHTKSGGFIKVGGVVDVDDEIRWVSGKMIVRSFTTSYSRSDGTKCDLMLAPIEAYQIVDLDEKQYKTSKTSKHVKKSDKKFKEA